MSKIDILQKLTTYWEDTQPLPKKEEQEHMQGQGDQRELNPWRTASNLIDVDPMK